MQKRPKSETLFNKLCEVIPGGVNSPVRSCKAMNQLPLVAERAQGDQVFDPDGNAYIDFCCSWGALIHGHAHPIILDAVHRRAAQGTSFGITSVIEESLAAKIVSLVESIDKIRFVSSGTEAAMTAVRLARGYTGRDLIVKFAGNYHGHSDSFLVQAGSGVFGLNQTSSSKGIPDEIIKYTLCLPYNDEKAVTQLFDNPDYSNRIAAVILEPIAANMGVVAAEVDFIKRLKELASRHGALLIFDEVITGFRVGLKGAQGLYGIKPDLTCYGKIIGGGFPAAALGGRKDVMDCLAPIGPVYQAGTLSGNPVAMEAGLQSLLLLEAPGFYEELERKTKVITEPVQEFLRKTKIDVCLQQAGSLFTLFFGSKTVRSMEEGKLLDLETFAEFFRYMFDHGVYIPPAQYEAWFVSQAHQEKNLEKTRDLILSFLSAQR